MSYRVENKDNYVNLVWIKYSLLAVSMFVIVVLGQLFNQF